MHRLVIITGYFISICVLGCLLAYPIYLLTGADFERVVSRTILILAVLLFYPTSRYLSIKNTASLGWVKSRALTSLSRAWVLGFIMLLPISIFFFSCGFRVLEPASETMMTVFGALLSAIFSGLLIGLIEESVFRGLLQTQLSQSMNNIIAIIIVSVIYSSVHFIQAPEHLTNENVEWFSGFVLLASAFANLANIHTFVDAWIALFLAGVFLSVVRLQTKNLIYCIGIHAGWVAHIKLLKEFTDRDNSAACANLASHYDNYVGELSTLLIVTILILWAILHYRKSTVR